MLPAHSAAQCYHPEASGGCEVLPSLRPGLHSSPIPKEQTGPPSGLGTGHRLPRERSSRTPELVTAEPSGRVPCPQIPEPRKVPSLCRHSPQVLQAPWPESSWAREALAQMFLAPASVKLSEGQGLLGGKSCSRPLILSPAEGGGRKAPEPKAFGRVLVRL